MPTSEEILEYRNAMHDIIGQFQSKISSERELELQKRVDELDILYPRICMMI